jgi:hypothetical protein
LKGRNATSFAKRTSQGRFREMDEQGRLLAADRRRKARRTNAGYGDKEDRAAQPSRSLATAHVISCQRDGAGGPATFHRSPGRNLYRLPGGRCYAVASRRPHRMRGELRAPLALGDAAERKQVAEALDPDGGSGRRQPSCRATGGAGAGSSGARGDSSRKPKAARSVARRRSVIGSTTRRAGMATARQQQRAGPQSCEAVHGASR